MTDPIPEAYLVEAIRRLNDAYVAISFHMETPSVQVLARTLQELGWKPPVDPDMRLVADIINAFECREWVENDTATVHHRDALNEALRVFKERKAALIALREGMGK